MKTARLDGVEYDLVDWNELSRRGLIVRANREIFHPLGLALCRDIRHATSPGALVSPDGVWTYPDNLK